MKYEKIDKPEPDGPDHIATYSWSRNEVASWLATHGGKALGAADLWGQICERLTQTGFPIMRASISLHDPHPQIAARGFVWRPGKGVEEAAYLLAERDTNDYAHSPIKVIYDGASGVRRRLEGEHLQLDFPMLEEIRAQGGTDYVAMPLEFTDGSRHFISFTTDRPGGFTKDQLRLGYDLMPLICLRIELEHSQLVTRTFLNTYMGGRASERIIGGTIRRNQGEEIEAVLLYSDLRQFTHMADTLPADQVVQILGEYYESVADPIEEAGGDIIKMMGDGILAIFPVEPGDDPLRFSTAGCDAFGAAKKAMISLRHLKPVALPPGMTEVKAGFALHAGNVSFGNVGSKSRLDFTVIGSAVNEVVRVETLTKTLGHSILATEAFADLQCVDGLMSLGLHALRGVRVPKEIFTVMEI